jgi:hypothetical protein
MPAQIAQPASDEEHCGEGEGVAGDDPLEAWIVWKSCGMVGIDTLRTVLSRVMTRP